MSALSEYGNPDNYVHWHDGRLCVDKDTADAAIESLKMCGSCQNFYECESEYRIAAGRRACLFTPSHWQEWE